MWAQDPNPEPGRQRLHLFWTICICTCQRRWTESRDVVQAWWPLSVILRAKVKDLWRTNTEKRGGLVSRDYPFPNKALVRGQQSLTMSVHHFFPCALQSHPQKKKQSPSSHAPDTTGALGSMWREAPLVWLSAGLVAHLIGVPHTSEAWPREPQSCLCFTPFLSPDL